MESGTGTGATAAAESRARRPRMPARRIVSAAVLAIGLIGCSDPGGEPTARPVAIREFRFMPGELTVRAGDTITWNNEDAVPHTATSEDGTWDTGSLGAKRSGTLVLETRGTHEYVCAFHPSMKGIVTVQ